jgi:hypothetical protein
MSKPKDLEAAGAALWKSVTDAYALEEHERLLLVEACRTADVIERLVVALDRELVDHQGKIRAELVELRLQRIVLARLTAALRVPIGEEGRDVAKHGPPRLQRRSGVRGVYAVKDSA